MSLHNYTMRQDSTPTLLSTFLNDISQFTSAMMAMILGPNVRRHLARHALSNGRSL